MGASDGCFQISDSSGLTLCGHGMLASQRPSSHLGRALMRQVRVGFQERQKEIRHHVQSDYAVKCVYHIDKTV